MNNHRTLFVRNRVNEWILTSAIAILSLTTTVFSTTINGEGIDYKSWGGTCDMTLLALDVDSGAVAIELDRDGTVSKYPDPINDSSAMFVYALYNSGTQGIYIKNASNLTSYATAFHYCFTGAASGDGQGAASLKDAKYKYSIPVSPSNGGEIDNISWGTTCDMTLLAMDVESGAVNIEMNRNGVASHYPDVIYDDQPMFVYSLYNPGSQGYSIKSANGSTSYVTAFYYCFTSGSSNAAGNAMGLYDAQYRYNMPVPADTGTVDIAGKWVGAWSSSAWQQSGTFSADIVQTGTRLEGSISVPQIGMYDAQLKGSVQGSSFVFGDIDDRITFSGNLTSASSASGSYDYPALSDSGSWQGSMSSSSAACVDVEGQWYITDQPISHNCGSAESSLQTRFDIVQTGCLIAASDDIGGVFQGSVDASGFSLTGSRPGSGGITSITSSQITVSADVSTLNGTAFWTWSGGSDSCSGKSSMTGNRI